VRAIVGLGNPGRRYAATRHNIGYILVDYIADIFKIPFSAGKGDYYFGWIGSEKQDVLLLKPTTYMNNSGLALLQMFAQFDVALEDSLIVYDDFNIPFGTLRFRAKGSDGGHNGIKSIIYHCRSEEFDRLKVGIGNGFDDVVDFVLSDFTAEERKHLPQILEEAVKGVETWIGAGIEPAMNLHNRHVIKQ